MYALKIISNFWYNERQEISKLDWEILKNRLPPHSNIIRVLDVFEDEVPVELLRQHEDMVPEEMISKVGGLVGALNTHAAHCFFPLASPSCLGLGP